MRIAENFHLRKLGGTFFCHLVIHTYTRAHVHNYANFRCAQRIYIYVRVYVCMYICRVFRYELADDWSQRFKT